MNRAILDSFWTHSLTNKSSISSVEVVACNCKLTQIKKVEEPKMLAVHFECNYI